MNTVGRLTKLRFIDGRVCLLRSTLALGDAEGLMRQTFVFLCLLAIAAGAAGQDPRTPQDLIAAFERTHGAELARVHRDILAILRQEAPGSSSTRRALGQSLRGIALEHTDRGRRVRAISVLSLAGDREAKVPFADAFALLASVYQNAPEAGIRTATLKSIASLADTASAFPFLRKVIQSDPPPGFLRAPLSAVEMLVIDGGDAGRRVAADLHRNGNIKNPDVLKLLNIWPRMNIVGRSSHRQHDAGPIRCASQPLRRRDGQGKPHLAPYEYYTPINSIGVRAFAPPQGPHRFL